MQYCQRDKAILDERRQTSHQRLQGSNRPSVRCSTELAGGFKRASIEDLKKSSKVGNRASTVCFNYINYQFYQCCVISVLLWLNDWLLVLQNPRDYPLYGKNFRTRRRWHKPIDDISRCSKLLQKLPHAYMFTKWNAHKAQSLIGSASHQQVQHNNQQ